MDSIRHPVDGLYDIVVTNIPFSQKDLPTEYYYDSLARNNGDSICILHCIKSLKQRGRMALVVPEGFVFRGELKTVREFLLDNSNLQTIISLPRGVFLPYAGVKTNILYFTDCHFQRQKRSYWYFTINSDGYTLDNHRREIGGDNDLNIVNSSTIEDNEEDVLQNLGFRRVWLEQIKNNNYIFAPPTAIRRSSKYKIVKLKDVILEMKDGGTPPRKKIDSKQYFWWGNKLVRC